MCGKERVFTGKLAESSSTSTSSSNLRLLMCSDKILQFSPKLSLKLESMVRRILIQRNEVKQSYNERNRGN
jgi:hypothetical protein